MVEVVLGQYGLSSLRYLGQGNSKWRGSETCYRYEFDEGQPVKMVDKRDVGGLLAALLPKGGPAFEFVRPAAPVAPVRPEL